MSLRTRYRMEAIGAFVTGLAAVITAIVPAWVEEVFHVDPDGGNGSLEWLLVFALALVAVALTSVAWREHRRLV
jgi:hypothetical protein